MVDLSVSIGQLKLKNPVTVASGTFGSGIEYSNFFDISKLGAITTKAVSLKPREGNPAPRICETPSGMLNSIGLQNPGLETFISKDLTFLEKFELPVIVNVAGESIEEYCNVAETLTSDGRVDAIELNLSCPNVDCGGMHFGSSADSIFEVVSEVRKSTNLSLIVKLSPNVSDIKPLAKAAENAGADAISLINTVLGMAIDIDSWKPKLARGVGGLSGPAIRPVAVRMVWEASSAVDIPIIGLGGIMDSNDAVEFMLAGATAISVGTANFVNPSVTLDIIEGLRAYCEKKRINSITEMIGQVRI